MLGVDTTVVLDGRVYAKPDGPGGAERMLEALSARTHGVVSGLCLLTPGWEVVETETTAVTFRELTPRDLAAYVATGEWEGRAGGYAIQGRGAALVERVEGDYLNVVGLPASLLIRLLAERFPGRLWRRLIALANGRVPLGHVRGQTPAVSGTDTAGRKDGVRSAGCDEVCV